MHGPDLLVATLSKPSPTPDQYGNHWQYHSRSDRHSKIACWGILLDLMEHCPTLVDQIRSGEVGFGINHRMSDFQQNRKKNLDLVICTPASGERHKGKTFASLAEQYCIALPSSVKKVLSKLPELQEAPVGTVRIALEAKAAMTAHVKALARLHDELNSSHLTIHGASSQALAVGFVMVNVADSFISSDMNKVDLKVHPARVSKHKQPTDTVRVIEKVTELPRTTSVGGVGFDALGLVVVDCVNDAKTPVKLQTRKPAPQADDIFHYARMIERLADSYRARFG